MNHQLASKWRKRTLWVDDSPSIFKTWAEKKFLETKSIIQESSRLEISQNVFSLLGISIMGIYVTQIWRVNVFQEISFTRGQVALQYFLSMGRIKNWLKLKNRTNYFYKETQNWQRNLDKNRVERLQAGGPGRTMSLKTDRTKKLIALFRMFGRPTFYSKAQIHRLLQVRIF